MPNKAKQISKYILYAISTNIIYGLILYHVCTWLSRYSLIYSYLGNLALIVIGLALDELTHKMYQSKRFVMQIKERERYREKLPPHSTAYGQLCFL